MTRLIDRIQWAKDNLDPVHSDYRVAFEVDPLDGALSVLVPDPNWMAAALHGNILPPVQVYQQFETDEIGRITNGHTLNAAVIGPMSEEEAMEYLVQKDIPAHVWQDNNTNAKRFIICRKDQLPGTRTFREAWTLKQEIAA